jgi:hypothetical protein
MMRTGTDTGATYKMSVATADERQYWEVIGSGPRAIASGCYAGRAVMWLRNASGSLIIG